MYSDEIDGYLRERRFVITAIEYLEIISNSPQIDHITTEHNGIVNFYTNDGYSWQCRTAPNKQVAEEMRNNN